MADDSSSKPSRCSLTGFLTASALKPPQKQTSSLFQEFRDEGLITKQTEKPNMTLDLRHPQLVHLYSSENETIAHNEPNGLGKDAAPGPSSTVSSPSGMISRPQMARRGGHFRGVNVRGGRPRSEMVSDDRDGSMPDRTANYGSIQSHRSPQSCATSYLYSDLGVNPKATHNTISNQVSCSSGRTDIIDITAFTQSDQNFPNLSLMRDDANVDVSDKPSTIIHLKMVAPSSGREESEAFVIATQSMNCEKAETGSSTPSGDQEGNLDGGRVECLSKDSTSFANPDQNVDGRATKRKLGDVSSDCDSSSTSDDDLPLIVHCKRSRKIASREGSSKDGRLMHEVKRTYERAITAQHGSAVGRADDPQKAVEKRGVVYEKSRGGVPTVAESGRLGMEMSDEPWKRSAGPRHSEGSSPRQRQLEEYERNSYAMRNVTDGKASSARKTRVPPGKSPSDGESPRNSKRNPAAGQTKKGLAPVVVASTRKGRLLRCLRPGPVSMKRRRMKEFGVNPRMMSQVLKTLTERRSRVGWTSKSFVCNSHQNYYDGYLVFRLTESLPAREKVTVRVPVESRDDLDPVGSESIVLWRMSDDEVDELQKQVKQEMEHKRTEHIMPMVLQMSYDQIETAYEQVKKDMKTYEITEKDSDVEEEDDEEDEEKDDEAEDEDGGERVRRTEEGVDKVEELENDTDENLHVRSYEIIVHDESSKTISCETVKYLEWRKKHPSLDNCEPEALRKEAENPRLFETGVENDPPFESPNAAKLVDPISEQTNYSRSRPKRHAVDYSPDAFAPIRLMEGKRLGGKKAAPAKPSARKKAVIDVCQEKPPSLTSSRDTSEGGDVNSDRKGGEKNHKNGSSGGEVRKSKGSAKRRQSHRRQKLPKSPQRKLETTSCDITAGKNTLSTTSPDREPLARDDNHNADVESDDEIPVILDVSDMPLSPAASSPAVVPEQIPVLCEHNNYVEKQVPPSAYDAVRNEYIRLRDLTRTAATDNAVVSSDAPVSAAGDNGEDCDVEMCDSDEKLRRETIEHHAPLLSGECFVDEQNRSRENSDLSHEASAPTQNAANGICVAANMPSLQRDGGGDVLGAAAAAAEELMAPPDLGLPIECVNSHQRPASPVLPPVLQVEASEMNDSGDGVTEDGRCSFPLLSSSESVGGGGDAVALREPIAGDVR